jgi:hypothetical protein
VGVLRDRCDIYVAELKAAVEEMDTLTEKIKEADPYSEDFEKMYEDEFTLAVKVVGIYEDLHINLERMLKEDATSVFYVNGVRKEVDKLVSFGYIEVGGPNDGNVH